MTSSRFKIVSHFNKDAMLRGEKAVWVLRFRGKVYQVEEIKFHVPITTKYRPNLEQQTRAVLEGFATEVIFPTEGKAVVQ